MSKLRVLPYKPGSKSAKELVRNLQPGAILKKQNSPVVGRTKLVLNWGHSSPRFSTSGVTFINKPEAVAKASNKLTALNVMKAAGVSVPEFTTDINIAKTWLADTYKVVCRTLLRANSGRGIVLSTTESELVPAPLYTRFLRKTIEYRVHVMAGEVIDFVRKRAKSRYETNPVYNPYIRSYEHGWIMSRDGISLPEIVKLEAIKAVTALGLDFGAVDIVVQTKSNTDKAYVLEVNTAAGLQGTTVTRYVEAIKRLYLRRG